MAADGRPLKRLRKCSEDFAQPQLNSFTLDAATPLRVPSGSRILSGRGHAPAATSSAHKLAASSDGCPPWFKFDIPPAMPQRPCLSGQSMFEPAAMAVTQNDAMLLQQRKARVASG